MTAAAASDTLVEHLLQQAATGVPVLGVTAAEMARLRAEQECSSGNTLAGLILRDPLMTLRVLRFLYSHRTRTQTADITTIAHAIMMLGQERFFREFADLPTVEERVGGSRLDEVRSIMSRSRLAALFARDWAAQRHDIDPEEVMVAALLHDIAPLLLLLSDDAGPIAPGVADALRPLVLSRLDLPGLVAELNEEAAVPNPRVLNVQLACRLASHCHAGWPAGAVRDDLVEVQRFLRTSEPQAWERVRRIVLGAAAEWHYYQTLPAAAYMPFVADEPSSADDDAGSAI